MLREHKHLSMYMGHHRTHIRPWSLLFPQTWWSSIDVWMKACLKNQLKFCSENLPISHSTTKWEIYATRYSYYASLPTDMKMNSRTYISMEMFPSLFIWVITKVFFFFFFLFSWKLSSLKTEHWLLNQTVIFYLRQNGVKYWIDCCVITRLIEKENKSYKT